MFYHIAMILKSRVHLKYHIAAMGSLLHDCSYCLLLRENCALKGSLRSHQNNPMLVEDSHADDSVSQIKQI